MEFSVREARKSDKEPLMSFIKDVWGGHDYIPHVWDYWIAEKSARMFVVETHGKPVAMNRIRLLEDGSAWFEGMRVHPDFRRLGLAGMLGSNAMKVAADSGATVYRLTSGSGNRASRGQVAKMGFAEVARFSVYEARKERRFGQQKGVSIAGEGDFGLVSSSIKKSREIRLGGGVVWDGFAAVSLTPTVIRDRLNDGSVYLADGAVAVQRPGREGKDIWNQIGFISGEPGPAMKLVDSIFSKRGRFDWRFVMVPQGSPLVAALRKHDLHRSFSNVLFERKAANG